MIIGVDGNEANVNEKVGVSVYALNILEYFQKKANKNLQFVIYLRKNPYPDLPPENEYFRYKIVKGGFLWSQFFLPLNLYFGRKIDVFFSPAHYSPRVSPVPTIVTVHDLSYFNYPDEFLKKDLYQLKNWTKYSVEKAKKVIAVSITTKKDIVKHYNIPEEKITVIYNGYEKQNQKSKIKNQNYISKFKIKSPYILYVGTLQPRKNITTLIKAFQKFLGINPEFKLLIVGKKGWLFNEIFQQVRDLKVEKSVKFLGFIPEKDLINLYKNAFCFVMPSFYEGFGIPILEAMNFNTPVISSFASSLPEVGSEACLYFDPNSADALFDKLIELKNNDTLRQELIKKGRERIKLFSWQKCATETLEILRNTK